MNADVKLHDVRDERGQLIARFNTATLVTIMSEYQQMFDVTPKGKYLLKEDLVCGRQDSFRVYLWKGYTINMKAT